MSDRFYLFLVGFYILVAMYLGIDLMIYGIVIVMFFEGATNLTLTSITNKMLHVHPEPGLLKYEVNSKFNFDGFRALRIFFSIALLAAYLAVNKYDVEFLWFLPWFFGFAIMGAGISTVCPLLLALRWLGFK